MVGEVHVDEFFDSALHGVEWVTFAFRPLCVRGKKETPETSECELLCVPVRTLSKREIFLHLSGIEPHLLGRSSHTLVHVPTAVFSSYLHFPHKKGYMNNGPVISNTSKGSKPSGLSPKVLRILTLQGTFIFK
jgi:hypothetical protein